MARGKCKDKNGICLEMIINGGDKLQKCMVHLYNDMLRTGTIESSWRETFFTLLPKKDLSEANNWRPVAILPVLYKIFARIIYNRIRDSLQNEQSCEQMGFMTGRNTDDALVILEEIISKCYDKHVPLWFASLDIRKAFDRIEWPALFEALGE